MRASGRSQTVAWIARTIGLKRQGEQRIANELPAEGYVRMIDNPDHKRARLLELSPAGAAAAPHAQGVKVPDGQPEKTPVRLPEIAPWP